MHANQELITKFYSSFRNRDYHTMQSCYADNASFKDEVFAGLNSYEVRAMWEMFCIKGKDLVIEYSDIHANEGSGAANWTARYTFSRTNRKVVNHIKARFTFDNGMILTHTDTFNFYRWAAQALGIPGILLGWTSKIKAGVRQQAMKNLQAYINSRGVK